MAPTQRRRHSCCIIDDRMFLFGGTGPSDKAENANSSEQPVRRHNRENIITSLNNFLQNLEPFLLQYGLNFNDHLRPNQINQNNNTMVIRTVFNLISTISRQLRPHRLNNLADPNNAEGDINDDDEDEEGDDYEIILPDNIEPLLNRRNLNNLNAVNQPADEEAAAAATPAEDAVENEDNNDASMGEADPDELLIDLDENESDQDEEMDDDDTQDLDLISYSDLHILELKSKLCHKKIV